MASSTGSAAPSRRSFASSGRSSGGSSANSSAWSRASSNNSTKSHKSGKKMKRAGQALRLRTKKPSIYDWAVKGTKEKRSMGRAMFGKKKKLKNMSRKKALKHGYRATSKWTKDWGSWGGDKAKELKDPAYNLLNGGAEVVTWAVPAAFGAVSKGASSVLQTFGTANKIYNDKGSETQSRYDGSGRRRSRSSRSERSRRRDRDAEDYSESDRRGRDHRDGYSSGEGSDSDEDPGYGSDEDRRGASRSRRRGGRDSRRHHTSPPPSDTRRRSRSGSSARKSRSSFDNGASDRDEDEGGGYGERTRDGASSRDTLKGRGRSQDEGYGSDHDQWGGADTRTARGSSRRFYEYGQNDHQRDPEKTYGASDSGGRSGKSPFGNKLTSPVTSQRYDPYGVMPSVEAVEG